MALVAAAAVVAVVAFTVLRSGDEDDGSPVTRGVDVDTAPTDDGEDPGRRGRAKLREGAAGDGVFEIDVENGSPLGGVAELEVESGERVELVVRADAPDDVHVHGYDLLAEVRPGRPAELRFRATLEGIYEVELEGTHTQIARLTVAP